MPVHENNCGAHRIEFGGKVPMITIDSLKLDPDVIWLDIEGMELHALMGGIYTIQKYHPLILCEEKGLSQPYGGSDGEIIDMLEVLGYQFHSAHGNRISVNMSRSQT